MGGVLDTANTGVERALADLEIQRWFDDRGLPARDVVERAAARWPHRRRQSSCDHRRSRVRRAEVDLAAATRIAPALRQPTRLWEVYGVHAMLALAAGRLSEADALIRKAYAFGERAQPEAAGPVYRLQRYILNDFSGQIEEVEPEIRDLVVEYQLGPSFAAPRLGCMQSSDDRRRSRRRSMSSQQTTSRSCPSIKNGSLA